MSSSNDAPVPQLLNRYGAGTSRLARTNATTSAAKEAQQAANLPVKT
jgi:hypothetical protein